MATLSGVFDAALTDHLSHCTACADQQRIVADNLAFMRELKEQLGSDLCSGAPAAIHPDLVPGYVLVRELARGGQGVVYEARQTATRRRAAVKIIDCRDLGADSSGSRRLQRLEREAELAASLRHPSIVTIFDRTTLPDGRYALAMEFVDGMPIDDWARAIDANAPPTREGQSAAIRAKLHLFAQLCDALHHAHINGIIHRDLKPANILVDEGGSPRIVDFGIARRIVPDVNLTSAGGFAGTLAYASPEQVSSREAVDTRSDVYSLGLILYEILTSRRPYDTEGSLSAAITNITSAPPAPLTVILPGNHAVGRELHAIVFKALAKLPAERYQSAAAFRSDIEHWLTGAPVEAHPQSAAYLLRKLVSRHRTIAAAATAFVVLLVAFAGFMTWSSRTLARQGSLLTDSLAASMIERGRLAGLAGENTRAEALLWPALLNTGANPEDTDLLFSAPSQVLQPAWALAELYSRHPSLMNVPVLPGSDSVRFEPGMHAVRVIRADGAQEIRSIPGGELLQSLPPCVNDSRGRSMLDKAQRRAIIPTRTGMVLIDLDTQKQEVLSDPRLATFDSADISQDGSRAVVTGGDGTLRLWQISPFEEIAVLTPDSHQHAKARFSPRGDLVLAGVKDQVCAWRAEDGELVGQWPIPPHLWVAALQPVITSVQLSPDGTRIAAAMYNALVLYSFNDPTAPPEIISAHRGWVNWVDFSNEGNVLLSTGSERIFKLWDAASNERLVRFELTSVRGYPTISPDGTMVAVCDGADRVRILETRPGAWLRRLTGAAHTVHAAQFSPDGRLLAAAGADGGVQLWRTDDWTEVWKVHVEELPLLALGWSHDGRHLVVGGRSGTLTRIEVASGSLSILAESGPLITWLAFAPGDRIVAAAAGAAITLHDVQTGRLINQLAGHVGRIAQGVFNHDGSILYSVGADGLCTAHDVRSGTVRFRTAPAAGTMMRAVCLSPDGTLLATGSDDWTLRLWDAKTGTLVRTITGVKRDVFSLVFHPKQHLLFSSGRDPAVQVWDVRTGRELAVLEGHHDLVLSIDVSRDGLTLISASSDRTVGVWDLARYSRNFSGSSAAWRSSAPGPGAPR